MEAPSSSESQLLTNAAVALGQLAKAAEELRQAQATISTQSKELEYIAEMKALNI